MTCIVGYVDTYNKNENGYNKIYMGGDSSGSNRYTINRFKNEKVFVKKDMIFGYTDSFRLGQILKYCFDIPKHVDSKTTYEYMCDVFMSHLISCFERHGYLKKDNDGQYKGGNFLLGYKGKLYEIQNNYSILEPIDNFCTCGTGDTYAFGALNILDKIKLKPEEKIRQALLSSEKFSYNVTRPFTIVSI